MKDKNTSNSLYITILNEALQKVLKKSKHAVADAIVKFKVKTVFF